MTGTARVAVTLIVFATMLVLLVVRPRRWNEAWWTMLAGAAMLLLGLVSPREALEATIAGKSALLFLLALLALSLLVGKSGRIGRRFGARASPAETHALCTATRSFSERSSRRRCRSTRLRSCSRPSFSRS